jgi:hypothetical protein
MGTPDGYFVVAMPVDGLEQLWVRVMETHVLAAHSHELAADLFVCLKDRERAAIEVRRAAVEKRAYARVLAWSGLEPSDAPALTTEPSLGHAWAERQQRTAVGAR